MSSATAADQPDDGRRPARQLTRQEHYEQREAARQAKSRALWSLVWARVKYWTWTVITKALITVVYLVIVSQGIVYLFPEMGLRLWKVPFFSWLNHFEATHRITLAHVFSVVPLVATWVLWHLILSMYIARDRFDKKFGRFALDQTRRVILITGVIVILADAGMFGASFTMSSWGSARVTPTAILATALYCAVIAFVSLISLFLGDEVTILKEKAKETSDVKHS